MKKNKWRFEALCRARIAQQELKEGKITQINKKGV